MLLVTNIIFKAPQFKTQFDKCVLCRTKETKRKFGTEEEPHFERYNNINPRVFWNELNGGV